MTSEFLFNSGERLKRGVDLQSKGANCEEVVLILFS